MLPRKSRNVPEVSQIPNYRARYRRNARLSCQIPQKHKKCLRNAKKLNSCRTNASQTLKKYPRSVPDTQLSCQIPQECRKCPRNVQKSCNAPQKMQGMSKKYPESHAILPRTQEMFKKRPSETPGIRKLELTCELNGLKSKAWLCLRG